MKRFLVLVTMLGLVTACGGGGGGSDTLPATNADNSPPPADLPVIVINEILASNDNGLLDEDGDSSDWIELYNPGVNAVDLTGWVLFQSDDNRWSFPAVTIGAGEYLVVFASGKNRRPTPANITDGISNLHTGFQLNRGGEYLALENNTGDLQPDGVFDPEYPVQRTDISYGIFANTLRYLENPTPGQPNIGPTYVGAVEDTGFSVDRGFFTDPFDVKTRLVSTGLRARDTWRHEPLGELLETRLALDVTHDIVRSTDRPGRERPMVAGALHEQLWLLSDRVILSAGARVDWTEGFDPQLLPAFGLVIEPKPWIRFRGQAGRAYRAPSFDEHPARCARACSRRL